MQLHAEYRQRLKEVLDSYTRKQAIPAAGATSCKQKQQKCKTKQEEEQERKQKTRRATRRKATEDEIRRQRAHHQQGSCKLAARQRDELIEQLISE